MDGVVLMDDGRTSSYAVSRMMVELQVMQLQDEHTTKYQNKLKCCFAKWPQKRCSRGRKGPRNRNFILKLSSLKSSPKFLS